MSTPGSEPTPAEVHDLAAEVEAVAAAIDQLRGRMRGSSDEVRRAGFRLDDVVGELRRAAGEIENTAGDLARVRTARDDRLCGIGWGVCPEHGNTLTSSGGTTRCRTCGREWRYDRAGQPCTEPVTHEVVDAEGGRRRLCEGHAVAARTEVIGGQVIPL